ncbi:hypothetical protein F7R12_00880 [Pseudomonas tolaasii]|nr:hypothetical protein B5P22_11580 [Pseudomonas tolaasii]KAB0477845.1 hypothetical protein F7R12_00880 [Pseudomonas tolaasii]
MRNVCLSLGVLIAGCSPAPQDFSEISISRFQSEEPERCRPSDVGLNEQQVVAFFRRAEQIDARTLHNEYDWAPCYLEGKLKFQGQACSWQVRAGATGQIECSTTEQYFGCNDCGDLFKGIKQ